MRNARGIFCAPKPLPRLLQAKNQSGAGRKRRCDFRRAITFCPSSVRGKRLPFLPALRKNLLHSRQRLKRPASFCPVTHASGEQKHYAQQRGKSKRAQKRRSVVINGKTCRQTPRTPFSALFCAYYDRQSTMSNIPYLVGKIKKYHNILCFNH